MLIYMANISVISFSGALERYVYILLALFVLPAEAQILPRPDHIVIVVEENKSFEQIIGSSAGAIS